MDRLKAVVPQAGQKPPILVYLGVLLQRGKLNSAESGELARWGARGRLWSSGAGVGAGKQQDRGRARDGVPLKSLEHGRWQ